MRRLRHNFAFTMIELMVVIGIIVLVLGLAVPVVRSLEGNRSVEAGYNRIGAALGRARQIALYYHQPAGIAIYYNRITARNEISFVQQAKIIQNNPSLDDRYYDTIPGEEVLGMPPGLATQVLSGNGSEPYLQFGLILFDENGQLANTPYWIPPNSYPNTTLATILAINSSGAGFTPGATAVPPALYSHSAICLYDNQAYQNQVDSLGNNFGVADSFGNANPLNSNVYQVYFNPAKGAAVPKLAEESWLNQNGQVLVIKPNDGSLLKN